jgi:hypothetical protein
VPVVEVTNPIEARRAKYSQYGGLQKTIVLNGELVSGIVKSVVAVPSASPARWIVTFFSNPARQTFEAPIARAARLR